MPISHIHSVAVFVNDLERALAFYRDTLGLAVTRQGSFGGEFFLEPAHIGIHPAIHPESKKLVGRHTGITFTVPGLLHYCGVLHDRGVEFLAEPTQMEWGIMAMIQDPERNVFALWENRLPGEDDAPASADG